ncbi:MAG TPA: competence/damage-inducible protein A [Gemmatimonadaceae bacterium]|nr:competence/damage-inducible protein A [Gemmatimonadaceae bacterium]
MQIEIITIGDELLLGFTIDTNAAHLARELAEEGVGVARRMTVGDEAAAIATAVREALDRTGAVITTGGLGPTADDLTRDAIAALFGRTLRRDEAIAERLRGWWRSRGLPGEMPESNLVQTLVPEGARVLPNRHGTAPGLFLEDERGRWVAMLPGVPREMRGLLADELLPIIRQRKAGEGRVIRSRTLRTTGIGESALADRLGNLDVGTLGVALAYLPGAEGVDLRLTVRGVPPTEADARLEAAAAQLRAVVGDRIYGEDHDDLASVVLGACRTRGWRLAVAESCTGGLLGGRLTTPAGSSDVFEGGVIAYDNRVKVALLGVDPAVLAVQGAVSEPVARQMASGVRERLGTDVGVAVTGIAGPTGGTPEKPVGTVWLAVDAAGATHAARVHLVGDRAEIRWRAAQGALDLVRRALERTGGRDVS